MGRRIWGPLSFLAGSLWLWFWEFVRAWFYDKGLHVLKPYLDNVTLNQLLHWGPPVILAAIGVGLFWRTRLIRSTAKISNSSSDRRSKLVRESREFVVRACAKEGRNADFREAAESFAHYFELRPYLSAEFLKKMNAPNTIYVVADGSNPPALATWFLDELDRLEKKWGLR